MSFFNPNSEKKNVAAQNGSAYGQYLAANANRGFDWRVPAALAAGPVAGYAVPAIAGIGGGGAAASAAGAGAGAGAGGAVASGLTLNSLLGLAGAGASLYGNITGQRAQTKATTAAQLEQQREFDQQIAMARETEATRKAEADRAAAEAKAQWDAQQKFQADQFKASEDTRLYNLKLQQDAEARRAPRRQLAQRAYMTLADLLHLGGQ